MTQDEIQIGSRLRVAPMPVLEEGIRRTIYGGQSEDDITMFVVYNEFLRLTGKDFTVSKIIRDGEQYNYYSEEEIERLSENVRLKVFSWALEPRDDPEECMPDPDLEGLFGLVLADDRDGE